MSTPDNPLAGAGGLTGLALSLGYDLAEALVSHFTKSKLPQELIDAAQNTVNVILAHKDDLMTKEQWEALRG